MKLLLSILFISFFFTHLQAQTVLKGIITDEKNDPVPGASVFLSNTSYGTRADDGGRFELTVPPGRYDLIVSSVGYFTWSQTLVVAEIKEEIKIRLKLRTEEMETVVIEPFEKDGWTKWGRFFTDNFIGQSDFSQSCILRNPEVLRFRHFKKEALLRAYASEPLIIENKALGYTISYQLESFSFDFGKRFLLYTGFPYFQPMNGSEAKQRRWQKNREEAYYGSIMHFMRAVYRNTLQQEGFDIRSLVKVANTEKRRVRALYAASRKRTESKDVVTVAAMDPDSSEYYNRVLQQEDEKNIIGKELLPGDSIAYAVNNTTAGLAFENYLLVIYKKKPAPLAYRQQNPRASAAMQSQIVLINGRPVEVQANGSFYDPADLMSIGYWAWSEKLATMLPFDYRPLEGVKTK